MVKKFSSPDLARKFIQNRLAARSKHLAFLAPIDSFSGYGQQCLNVYSGLQRLKYEVDLVPIRARDDFGSIPVDVRSSFKRHSEAAWELMMHPPDYPKAVDRPRVWFTMYESSKLDISWVNRLNESLAVIVPSAHSADAFSSSGVRVPIKVVPLGVDMHTYSPAIYPSLDMCVFGAAGRYAHGGRRKGLALVIEAFLEAFKREIDVVLKVKCFDDCEIPETSDPRIEVLRPYLNPSGIAEWLNSLHWFVSASNCEGWGLWAHQALACGRPVISARYGGVAEYFNNLSGLVVDYDYEPATGMYEHRGYWASPNKTSLIEQMRHAYEHRDSAVKLGQNGRASVMHLTPDNMCRKLDQAFHEIGLVQ